MRIACLIALAASVAPGCDGGSDEAPCRDGAPGLHFVIHLDGEAGTPADLSVTYSDTTFDRYEALLPPGPWSDPLTFDTAYGPAAVNGTAMAYFLPRPDPPRAASTSFDVDLARCVTVEMTRVPFPTP